MPLNNAYIKSISGLIKSSICLVLIITLICACVNCVSYRIFFLLVSLFGFLVEFGFFLCYLFSLTGKLSLNWPFTDFIASVVMAALSFINFCVSCYGARLGAPQDGAAAFFWIVALLLFCVDCYYCYRAWRGGSHGPPATTTVGPSFVSEPPPASGPSYPGYPQDSTQGGFEYSN
ncbi:hypothetical protein ECG_09525 [Echinococcus granulosus]|uniref:Marvel n=1 Tax=Echinococcus granulosus TaxID=6210 RepID=A0A068WSP9_ECHGR|nr:hypothetical protein ECG_09525 [Echinococcus granulosus]CDS20663.1 Marvel [Echinococcus granulosus]